MERESSLNTSEYEQQLQIKQVVENNFGWVTHYLITTNPFFPRVCGNASVLLEDKIKEQLGVKIRFCEGSRCDNTRKYFCDYHEWLEYGDLIIDPTDYQFDIDGRLLLPPTPDFVSENGQPRKKEYFYYLCRSVAQDQNKTDFLISELKRCFGCKIFYSKSDPNYSYQDHFNDTENN